MALVVLLVDGHDGSISVDPDTADRLARLGVTNVAVVRDHQTTGLVLDGWLFDLAAAPDAARAIVGPDRPFRRAPTAHPDGPRGRYRRSNRCLSSDA